MSRRPGSSDRVVRVLAVDPGRDKCGLAVVDARDGVLARGVVPTTVVGAVVQDWVRAHRPVVMAVGGGTGLRAVRKALSSVDLPVEVVPEAFTTRRARKRYFEEHPLRGWRRLFPGMQSPPIPIDDYAAVLIAEDYLSALSHESPAKRPLRGDE